MSKNIPQISISERFPICKQKYHRTRDMIENKYLYVFEDKGHLRERNVMVRTVQMLAPDSSVGREPDMRLRVHIPSDSTTHVLPVWLFFQSVCCLRGYKMWFVCAVRVSSVNTASNGYFMRWLVPVSPSITSPSLTDSHPLLVSWWRYWRNSRLYSTTRKSPLYSMYMVSCIVCC